MVARPWKTTAGNATHVRYWFEGGGPGGGRGAGKGGGGWGAEDDIPVPEGGMGSMGSPGGMAMKVPIMEWRGRGGSVVKKRHPPILVHLF